MKEKIAVSLPNDLVAAVRAAVDRGDAASVSAYVADALAAKVRHDSLVDVLDEMDRQLGMPGEEADRWARQVLGL